VIAATASAHGSRRQDKYGAPPPGDRAKLVAASDRMRSELGREPRKPALEVMVADAWAFAQARPNGYAQ
jgi:UDP-glucose 4-epimerase